MTFNKVCNNIVKEIHAHHSTTVSLVDEGQVLTFSVPLQRLQYFGVTLQQRRYAHVTPCTGVFAGGNQKVL